MVTRRSCLLAGILLASLCPHETRAVAAEAITPLGRQLARFYDGLGVETHWIAGQHIDWRTGDPDGSPERLPGRHTHCSAFVAAAAERLGIYILRPPEHRQVLLANAQNEWLPGPGAGEGWRRLDGPLDAQRAADAGAFVVASYHNHRDDKPGHIAIVRPGGKPPDLVSQEGPDVIQAGAANATRISLRDGFAGHPHAWADAEVDYYAHAIPAGRL